MINAHWLINTMRNQCRPLLTGKLIAHLFGNRNPLPIRFIGATRMSELEFWENSPLGIGLKPLLEATDIQAEIKFSNASGLPLIYNEAIRASQDEEILVFLHDDIWILDDAFIEKIRASMQRFDVVGVAGNTRRSKYQPAWLFHSIQNYKFVWDRGHLSGAIRHGKPGRSEVSEYGPTPAKCELLDGVLLIAKRSILRQSNVNFEEKLRFHFYDMDFCRSARMAGLSLGTWPLDIIHLSAGSFGNPSWREGYAIYMDKWKI